MGDPSPARSNAIIALICSIWFLLTGSLWTYGTNLVISFPVAIVGFFLWLRVRKVDPVNRMNRVTGIVLLAGLFVSAAVLVGLLISN